MSIQDRLKHWFPTFLAYDPSKERYVFMLPLIRLQMFIGCEQFNQGLKKYIYLYRFLSTM